MEKKLKSAIADETREDLKLLLQSYVLIFLSLLPAPLIFEGKGMLTLRSPRSCSYSSQMSKLKPKWIPMSQFRAPEPVKSVSLSLSFIHLMLCTLPSNFFRIHSRRELLDRPFPPLSSTRPSLSPLKALPPPLLLLSLEPALQSRRKPPPPPPPAPSSILPRPRLRLRLPRNLRSPRSTRTSRPNSSRPVPLPPSPPRPRRPSPSPLLRNPRN